MNVLNIFDRFALERVLDLSEPIDDRIRFGFKNNKWNNPDFLAFDDMRGIKEDVPKDVIEKVHQGISELVGREVGEKNYNHNPALNVLYDAYRIEGRKEFIKELEKAKQKLNGMFSKPHSKRRDKDIRSRIRNLQKHINIHRLGTERAFLTMEDVKKYQNQNNTNLRVFEYTTICPIMELADKYDKALDVLEEAGVPNVSLFRGLEKRTRESFMQKWSSWFVPESTVYLATYRDEAIEDVIRRVPAQTSGGEYDSMTNANLEDMVKDPKVQQKIRELGLPEEETTFFLKNLGQEDCPPFERLRIYLLRATRDFFKSQLSHEDPSLKWIAVRALSDSTKLLDELYGSYVPKKERREQARKQEQEYAHFKREEVTEIMSALNIQEKYPTLAQHPSLIAERFLKSNLLKFEGDDPYGLGTFEHLVPIMKKAGRSLGEYGIRMSLGDFTGVREIEKVTEGLEWIADNLDSGEYEGLSGHPYFRKALSEWDVRELLKESSWKISDYFKLVKEASLKLGELAEKVSPEQIDRIHNCLFNTWEGINDGDENYTLTFIELFADSEIKDEDELKGYLSEMSHFSSRISHLPEDKRQETLQNFRIWKKLQKHFGFADYMNDRVFTSEILPLGAKPETVEEILGQGFFPTEYLVKRFEKAKDKGAEVKLWKTKQSKASQGKFSLEDKVMVNLEYTNYRRFINSCAKEPDHFDFEHYHKMVTAEEEATPPRQSHNHEINFLCVEANRLLNYLRQVRQKSEEVGRDLIVVPNYSYGAVATLPIEDILREEGFRIIPARIGSTECHNNSKYVKERLFPNETNKEILTNKPNIVVVDGTAHLEPDQAHKTGRYPDSHQGYVNYIVIINDILTDNDAEVFASDVCKSEDEVKGLRYGDNYKGAREYIETQMNGDEVEKGEHYRVGFWNPAGLGLSLRRGRRDSTEFKPESEDEFDVSQPRMIIANSVMPSFAMPEEMTAKYGEHRPAYFDDHYEATEINFRVTPNGIRYSNLLEEQIKKRYVEMFGEE